MYAVGALLLAFATGRWGDFRPDAQARDALPASGIKARVVDALWERLDRVPGARPTATELADAFAPAPVGASDPERQVESRATLRVAVFKYRELTRDRPDAYRPELASRLNSPSSRLSELGRRDEAQHYHRSRGALPGVDARAPRRWAPEPRRGLNNLSVRLGDAGFQEDALTMITEAVALFRRWPPKTPATTGPASPPPSTTSPAG